MKKLMMLLLGLFVGSGLGYLDSHAVLSVTILSGLLLIGIILYMAFEE